MTVENSKANWLILGLQIVAIVTLLACNPPSHAGDDDNDSSTQVPAEPVDNMPVPYHYVKNPPDEGFRYWDNDDDNGNRSVWVPGLTDGMDAKHKSIYYDLKKQDPKVVWDYRRKEVAKVIKYAQNNPSTECRTVINDSATAVALVCKKPGGATTSFPNMVASQFDKYLDDVMITPMEDAGVSVATGGGGVMGPGQQQHFSGNTSSGSQQTDGGRGPASTGGPNGGSAGGGIQGPSTPGGGYNGGSAYSYYISSQVAPNTQQVERNSDSVFSDGQEEFVQLDDLLKAKAAVKLTPSNTIQEGKKGK
jgi:hypothetical protein